LDWFLGLFGLFLSNICHLDLNCIGIDLNSLSIKMLFGKLFSVFALLMGVDLSQITEVGALLGSKFVLNEAIAFTDLVRVQDLLNEKSYVIAVFALSGFANISSVAIQISGIGEIAPNQRKNLARMGIRALIGGTITSYISACMAGMLI
ncbi:NupC/NupG family nucleoside CNT transporter, partial [bacterium]|nr:NupC/NupG family nucleoside CNT transporter [bacterium]